MREAIQLLDTATRAWAEARAIPEVDWSRMRSLNFQEVLQERQETEKKLGNQACKLCADFETHVGPLDVYLLFR
jgi:antiviral helicase SKI2